MNSSAVIVTLSNDVPCFDHDGNGKSLGLLIEEARTNLALWNRDHTNAVWVATTMTQAKDATGLDGVANSATTLTATAGNATSLQTVTTASAAYTFSIYVKRVTGSGNIDITDNNGTNWTTLTGLSSSAWTRYTLTRTQANPVIGVRIVTSGDAVEVDYGGLEAGSFATSAIATTTSTVTRAADVATVTDMGWYADNAPGTIFVSSRSAPGTPPGGTIQNLFKLSDGTTSNALRFQVNELSDKTWVLDSGAVGQLATTVDFDVGNNEDAKDVIAFATNDFAMSLNGGAVSTDTSGNLFAGASELKIGSDQANAFQWNGHIAELKYWNVRKNNSFLQAVTQ